MKTILYYLPVVLLLTWAISSNNAKKSSSLVHIKTESIMNKSGPAYTEPETPKILPHDLVEIKEQIFVEQLPPNVYYAIETKYPNFSITSAYTVKNNKILCGCYSATLRSQEKEIEVTLNEKGAFIK